MHLVMGGLGEFPAIGQERKPPPKVQGYAGSVSCRECHERFYQLWSTSFHGLAMQPYTPQFAKAKLTPQKKDITIGKSSYEAEIRGDKGWVIEKGRWPWNRKKYPIEHVLGGKNVYYFLTPMDRGRLQVLPLAYDVTKKEWFDTAASGVRHFPGRSETDEPVSWRDQQYTFNTACYSCHVSQLSTNYDLKPTPIIRSGPSPGSTARPVTAQARSITAFVARPPKEPCPRISRSSGPNPLRLSSTTPTVERATPRWIP